MGLKTIKAQRTYSHRLRDTTVIISNGKQNQVSKSIEQWNVAYKQLNSSKNCKWAIQIKGKGGPRELTLWEQFLWNTQSGKHRNKTSPALKNLFPYPECSQENNQTLFCFIPALKYDLWTLLWFCSSLSHVSPYNTHQTTPIAMQISNTQQEMDVISSSSDLANRIADGSWVLRFRSIKQVRSRLKVLFSCYT